MDTGAVGPGREGALAEVTLDGVLGQVEVPLATPAEQVVGGDEDVAFAGVAAGPAACTIERLAGHGVGGGQKRPGQFRVQGNAAHGGLVDRGRLIVNLECRREQC